LEEVIFAGLGALQGESLSFDPEVSGPKGRMNPTYATDWY